ncbi:MAG: trypsin-like serine protease [Chthoniobacterales bacterium]|nr:trypsin-like serine protease [Chthoniobacterales bacterium]
MKHYLLLALAAVSSTAGAVVIRDDVEDQNYQIPASAIPALADFPGEGHGALIAPQWVITVAHVASPHSVKEITINGLPRRVQSTVIHPGYRALPDALVKEALASGDASKAMAFLASSDDIALVKLVEAVTDVKPIPLFRGNDEIGKTVQLIGKGATGTGSAGEMLHGPHRTTLRRAFNEISSASERWISYTFDPPETALPLEGITGSGDSGGPVLIRKNRQWQLAGLASWKSVQGDVGAYRPGRYGDGGNNVRISSYIAWIESVMFSKDPGQPRQEANNSLKPKPLRGSA